MSEVDVGEFLKKAESMLNLQQRKASQDKIRMGKNIPSNLLKYRTVTGKKRTCHELNVLLCLLDSSYMHQSLDFD